MRNAFCLAMCALCLAAAAAERARPVRVSFESLPEGATVVLDGERRGVTPITLYDVDPGVRHVRFDHPHKIMMDGKKQTGVVLLPEEVKSE